MTTEESLFAEAAGLPAAEQAAYLEKACAAQPELRARVEELLRAHQSDGFMEGPGEVSETTLWMNTAPDWARALPKRPGTRIGRYRLLQQIGEGGFGVVWMAEQMEPFTRRVALKVIRAGMDTREVIARFEAERQALALMDHPNIAQVFDAGATDQGRPYFVMELVKGVPITQFCDDRASTTRQRLELFGDVCSAINHAHQKGVIHRDIKPSNVMVTLHCDKPVIKVIDFGIARATQGPLTDKTLFTRFEQFVGTPAYMSPEQSALGGLDMDTRSDIYALGVLLYELLTGRPPFETKSLLSAGYEEMRRIIREVDPPKPSARLNTIAGEERTAVAKARQIEPEQISRLVEPDLDWIVMKAIEKDRTRRYETANGLALDILRFLADEPVSAGPPTAAYRFGKFARRHRAALHVGATIAVVLVAATTISVWQAVRATRAERLALGKTADEKLAREDAEAVSSFLTEVFRSPDPARDGRTITVAEMLDRAAMRLNTDMENQPEHRAKMHGALGRTYHALGLYDPAISQLEKCRDAYKSVAGVKYRGTLNAMRDIALACIDNERTNEALNRLEEVTKYYRETLGENDSDTLQALQYLAYSYGSEGRVDDALKLREFVLDSCRTSMGREHPQTLFAMNELVISLQYFERSREQAVRLQEETVILQKKIIGERHPDTLQSMSNLAQIYRQASQWDDALNLLREVRDGQSDVLGSDHPSALFSSVNFAYVCLESDRIEEAMQWLKEIARNPPADSLQALRISALLAWLGLSAEHETACRKILERAADTNELTVADRAAKGYCLKSSTNPQMLEMSLALARRAASGDPNHPYAPWFQMSCGLAEYRQGNYLVAERWFANAERGAAAFGTENLQAKRQIQSLTGLYSAMTFFRQSKQAESHAAFFNAEAQMMPLPLKGQPSKATIDHNDLICWLAYKEAKALLFFQHSP